MKKDIKGIGKNKLEMKEVIIEGQGIKKEYHLGSVIVKALRGVSLKIEEAEFVVIVGPSGSGKSTLMHILGALDMPTAGEVIIDDNYVSQLSEWSLAMLRRKKIGFIFQTFNLIPTLSALENVAIPLEPTNIPKDEALLKAKKLLEEVGLGDRLYHKPNELSGGQRQRVSIARSLINDPKIIFADEPTGNLDSVTGDRIIDLMRKLNKQDKKTFVIVTHDESLLEFATTKYFLKDGLINKTEKNHGLRKYVG